GTPVLRSLLSVESIAQKGRTEGMDRYDLAHEVEAPGAHRRDTVEKRAEGEARECTADAHPADADLGELRERDGRIREPHHDVDRATDGRNHHTHVVQRAETRRAENARPSPLEGRESAHRI